MDYLGEQLLPGQIGHFFIVLSLVSSAVAAIAYFISTRLQLHSPVSAGQGFPALAINPEAAAWRKLARIAFITEVVSVLAVFGILFYIIYNHLFEYKYAWQHSSRALEFKYLLASFWEGQEGSFLLWSIWHCVLGSFLIRFAGRWESPVMTVISVAQFCLATMLLGIYVFGAKVGSNPFILLRDSGVLDNAPSLHLNFDVNLPLKPDYLSSIRDGNDLNPLLQNYWMVIHPPVLFLGFASTIVPFAFAFAGLWTKAYKEWSRPALPWTLFAAATLGVGIMMGAMWAYESLTFGGYWAWDPVENASLVPWMILVSGIHTLLIFRHTGHALRSSFLFLILGFGFILYSTFLTRSGILGEASVHAFTDLGMNAQLLGLLLLFVVPALLLLFSRYRDIPHIRKEESGSSREFWMFIGSLVFFLSGILIISQTSLPVVNKIFGVSLAQPENMEFWYNQIQVFVAVIIGVLTAIGQYFRYRDTPSRVFWKKMWIPAILSALVATAVLLFGKINYDKETYGFMVAIWIAVAASIYAIIANAAYIWIGLKGKLRISGGSISHVGFGMVLLGILISSGKKEVLSNNMGGIPAPLASDENPRENLTLVKGLTVDMGKYSLTYEGDSAHPKKQLWYYKIRFRSRDGKEEFLLTPNAFVNYKGQEGLMSNPDSRHYWNHDVFTYITSIANPDRSADTTSFRSYPVKKGDTVFYSTGFVVFRDLASREDLPTHLFGDDGSVEEAALEVFSKTGTSYKVAPKLVKARGETIQMQDTVLSENLVLQLKQVNPDRSVVLGLKESNAIMDYITLKAYKFPFIRMLWLGVVVTAIGIIISMVQRIRERRSSQI
jgi:cytochrome c-type biogenesis protein CcmF